MARVWLRGPNAHLRDRLTERQALVLDCMMTRHHDGFVRQEALARIVWSEAPWVMPFVVRLVGEYVLEIVISIADELRSGDSRLAAYRAFARENRDFIAITRQRAVSYWNCYYRAAWPDFDDYPAKPFLDRIQDARRSVPEPGVAPGQ